jgi:hypothetical protein
VSGDLGGWPGREVSFPAFGGVHRYSAAIFLSGSTGSPFTAYVGTPPWARWFRALVTVTTGGNVAILQLTTPETIAGGDNVTIDPNGLPIVVGIGPLLQVNNQAPVVAPLQSNRIGFGVLGAGNLTLQLEMWEQHPDAYALEAGLRALAAELGRNPGRGPC